MWRIAPRLRMTVQTPIEVAVSNAIVAKKNKKKASRSCWGMCEAFQAAFEVIGNAMFIKLPNEQGKSVPFWAATHATREETNLPQIASDENLPLLVS